VIDREYLFAGQNFEFVKISRDNLSEMDFTGASPSQTHFDG